MLLLDHSQALRGNHEFVDSPLELIVPVASLRGQLRWEDVAEIHLSRTKEYVREIEL